MTLVQSVDLQPLPLPHRHFSLPSFTVSRTCSTHQTSRCCVSTSRNGIESTRSIELQTLPFLHVSYVGIDCEPHLRRLPVRRGELGPLRAGLNVILWVLPCLLRVYDGDIAAETKQRRGPPLLQTCSMLLRPLLKKGHKFEQTGDMELSALISETLSLAERITRHCMLQRPKLGRTHFSIFNIVTREVL